jgi:hypothetical protein
MIVEVNDSGEILIPAELVRAAPQPRLEADRDGEFVILKPLRGAPAHHGHGIVSALPNIPSRPADPEMTFRREAIYGPDAAAPMPPGSAVFLDTNILIYSGSQSRRFVKRHGCA